MEEEENRTAKAKRWNNFPTSSISSNNNALNNSTIRNNSSETIGIIISQTSFVFASSVSQTNQLKMSKPDWVGEDVGKLFLWGEAVKLQIPDKLLAHEASTRGFVGQPLGGKDEIVRIVWASQFPFPLFRTPWSHSKLCTPIKSPYWITIRNSHSVSSVGAGNNSDSIFLSDFVVFFTISVHEGTTKLFPVWDCFTFCLLGSKSRFFGRFFTRELSPEKCGDFSPLRGKKTSHFYDPPGTFIPKISQNIILCGPQNVEFCEKTTKSDWLTRERMSWHCYDSWTCIENSRNISCWSNR